MFTEMKCCMNQLHVVGSASGQYSECAGELVCLSLRNVVGHERLPCAPTSSGNGRQPGRSGQESLGRSQSAIRVDRPAVLKDSLRNCPNYGVTEGRLVSERVPEDNWNATAGDFAVPTLILHGDVDRILPADATSRRQAKMIKNVRFVELKGGPHGALWTHAEEVNSELVKFLA